MRTVNQIILASNNSEKFREFTDILKAYPDLELIPVAERVRNFDKLSFVENKSTYLDNAIEKARHVNLACHYPALGDDSGLEVAALPGELGVHSRRYAIPKAGVGQDQANNTKLLEALKGKSDRSAQFICTLTLVLEGLTLTSTANLKGKIADSPRGGHGFGYDPLFIPEGSDRTLAEMTENEKNLISHRAKALHELISKMKSQGMALAKP